IAPNSRFECRIESQGARPLKLRWLSTHALQCISLEQRDSIWRSLWSAVARHRFPHFPFCVQRGSRGESGVEPPHSKGCASLLTRMKTTVWLAVLLLAASLSANAQRGTGTISGRIVTEDGQPLPRAVVSIFGVGGSVEKMMSGRLAVATD